MFIPINTAVHTVSAQPAHVQSVVPPSNAAPSPVATQSVKVVTSAVPMQTPRAVQSLTTTSREIRQPQHPAYSPPLGTSYSFAALVDPSNTFQEGKYYNVKFNLPLSQTDIIII